MSTRLPPVPNTPRPIEVKAREAVPITVGGSPVEEVLNDWLVEDRWWTKRGTRRRYWEVVTAAGRRSVVFRDLETGRWYEQGG